uniref:HTH_38 domain-containing protein n=1 Tax=Heterorhabditis bacteriophora TaxID=37862 RepID=A0A1I7XQ78_HETBA
MCRASTLSLHERGRIKVLSTTGYTVKQIADVVKRSKESIMNFLPLREEYDTKKGSGRPSKLNDREKREILRTASNSTISINEIRRACGIDASKTTVWRMLDKCPNIVRSRMKKCSQLTQGNKDERLCWLIFSEEKKFSLDGPDDCHSYWRYLNKEPRHFLTRNFSRGSIDLRRVQRYSTDRLGVYADEDQQRGLPEYLRTSISPASRTFLNSTKTWLKDNDVNTKE